MKDIFKDIDNAPLPLHGRSLHEVLEDAERRAIIEAFRVSHGNMCQAAKSLGVSRQTVYRRLEGLGFNVHDLRQTLDEHGERI